MSPDSSVLYLGLQAGHGCSDGHLGSEESLALAETPYLAFPPFCNKRVTWRHIESPPGTLGHPWDQIQNCLERPGCP